MTTKYRAAVIGVGRAGNPTHSRDGGWQVGYVHSRHLIENPAIELVAGADINADNLAAWQREFGEPLIYRDYQDMLSDVRPELVSICTQVVLHRRMIEDCARAGVKGIFCEKPFLASPSDLEAVQKTVNETGIKILVAHIHRYDEINQRVRQLIKDGTIGAPQLFWARMPRDLSEVGSHTFDMFRYFNDDAAAGWVMGQMRVRDFRGYGHAMEDHGVAYFELSNGCRGLIEAGNHLEPPFTTVFLGSAGEIRLTPGDDGTLQLRLAAADKQTIESYQASPFDGHTKWQAALTSLVQWLDGAPEPMLGTRNALLTSELNLGAYLSAARRDRVDLPLEDFSAAEWPLDDVARQRNSEKGGIKQ